MTTSDDTTKQTHDAYEHALDMMLSRTIGEKVAPDLSERILAVRDDEALERPIFTMSRVAVAAGLLLAIALGAVVLGVGGLGVAQDTDTTVRSDDNLASNPGDNEQAEPGSALEKTHSTKESKLLQPKTVKDFKALLKSATGVRMVFEDETLYPFRGAVEYPDPALHLSAEAVARMKKTLLQAPPSGVEDTDVASVGSTAALYFDQSDHTTLYCYSRPSLSMQAGGPGATAARMSPSEGFWKWFRQLEQRAWVHVRQANGIVMVLDELVPVGQPNRNERVEIVFPDSQRHLVISEELFGLANSGNGLNVNPIPLLMRFKGLTHLKLEMGNYPELERLAELKKLEHLKLEFVQPSEVTKDFSWAFLSKLPDLQRLEFRDTPGEGERFLDQPFRELSQLKCISIDFGIPFMTSYMPNAERVAKVWQVSDLERAALKQFGTLSEDSFEGIVDAKKLRYVDLTGSRPTASALMKLLECRSLEILILNDCKEFWSGDLKNLKAEPLNVREPTLKELGLRGIRVWGDPSASAVSLGALLRFYADTFGDSLETLDISHTFLHDAALSSLIGCNTLKHLNLSATQITDESHKRFYVFSDRRFSDPLHRTLVTLDLSRTKVGPQVMKALEIEYLLRELKLAGCDNVTPKMCRDLAKALPKCRIQMPDGTWIEPSK